MKTLLVVAMLGLLAGGFLWERNAMDGLRAQNEALRNESQEAGQLAVENRELEALRSAAGPGKRIDRVELLRLRNEVRRLRAVQQEAEKLRAANQRVADEIKSGKFIPRRLADMEGAVPREKWTMAGFSTPEAAVQSFFAAAASGDPQAILNCASPNHMHLLNWQMTNNPVKFRKEFLDEWTRVGQLSGFRIMSTRKLYDSDEHLEVLVQVVADGEPLPLDLQRVGNEWKIDH